MANIEKASIEKLQKIVEELKLDPNFALLNIRETYNHMRGITVNFTENPKWKEKAGKSLEHITPTHKKILDQIQELSGTEPALALTEKPKKNSPN